MKNLNSRQNSVCSGLQFSFKSKLFGGGPPCPRTTSATLHATLLIGKSWLWDQWSKMVLRGSWWYWWSKTVQNGPFFGIPKPDSSFCVGRMGHSLPMTVAEIKFFRQPFPIPAIFKNKLYEHGFEKYVFPVIWVSPFPKFAMLSPGIWSRCSDRHRFKIKI